MVEEAKTWRFPVIMTAAEFGQTMQMILFANRNINFSIRRDTDYIYVRPILDGEENN